MNENTEMDHQIQLALSDMSVDPQVFYPDPEHLPEEPEHQMTAKAFLSRGRYLMKQIETLNDQIFQLDALAKRITGTWQQEVVSRSRNVTAREEIIARILDKEAELQADIWCLLGVRDEIEKAIACVRNPKTRMVLEKYYLCNMTWEEIATDLNNNSRWVKILAKRGVEIVQTVLDKG